ncbi:MAG: hypothetical protein OHK93_001390 [Ramalina farinacea]|uniref:DUF7492 domain-containing protein n=1 Tax=Ramalina farinacea TaxID=258253 RepID=A0AA43QTS7_9LECA|nr:hypothetical protein [Ramalina farinacea]
MYVTLATALVALATYPHSTSAHSWIEQMNIIDSSGQFTGTPGYARNFTPRTAPGFTDTALVHILPPSDPLEARDFDTDGISATDPMCRKSQQEQYQSNGFPRLSVQPGNMIALRYEENGHVTLPQNQKGKPPNRGTVYVYGTTQPKPTENFLDVYKQWDAAGTGGDKRGKLLATQNFDDGRCYQVNSGAISQARQSQFPHSPDKTMGTDIWCQTDMKIPDDAPAGKPYTLYWVWDWPTEPNVDPAVPKGKAEIYTTCMDVDVKSASKERSLGARAAQAQNLNSMAIPSLVSSLANPSAAAPASSQAAAPASSQAAASPAPQNNAATASQPASGAASAVAPVAAAVQQPNQVAAQPSQAAPTSSMGANAPSGLASAESIVLSVLGPQVITEIAAQVHTQAPVTVTVTEQQAPGGCPTASANMPASPPAASSAAANPTAANTAAAVPAAATSAAMVPAAANTASANPVAANSAAQDSAAQPPATTTVTSGTSTIFQSAAQTATSTLTLNPTAGNSEEPSAMPISLQMTSPLMGPTSAAEVPAASASPAASSAADTPASSEASQPSGSAGASPALPTLPGTATPVASPAANTAGSSPSASGAATPSASTGSSGTTAAKRCDAGTCRKAKKSQIFS